MPAIVRGHAVSITLKLACHVSESAPQADAKESARRAACSEAVGPGRPASAGALGSRRMASGKKISRRCLTIISIAASSTRSPTDRADAPLSDALAMLGARTADRAGAAAAARRM